MQPTARFCETVPALCDDLSAGLRNVDRSGSFRAAKRGSFVSCVCSSSVERCGVARWARPGTTSCHSCGEILY